MNDSASDVVFIPSSEQWAVKAGLWACWDLRRFWCVDRPMWHNEGPKQAQGIHEPVLRAGSEISSDGPECVYYAFFSSFFLKGFSNFLFKRLLDEGKMTNLWAVNSLLIFQATCSSFCLTQKTSQSSWESSFSLTITSTGFTRLPLATSQECVDVDLKGPHLLNLVVCSRALGLQDAWTIGRGRGQIYSEEEGVLRMSIGFFLSRVPPLPPDSA